MRHHTPGDDYFHGDNPTSGPSIAASEDVPLEAMKVADLKATAAAEGIDLGDASRKDEIIEAILEGREAIEAAETAAAEAFGQGATPETKLIAEGGEASTETAAPKTAEASAAHSNTP